MKISKIQLIDHPILGNITQELIDDKNNNSFNLLIGQNGSGKTQLIELIYKCLENGFSLYQREFGEKISLTFSESEANELGIDYTQVRFEYNPTLTRASWNQIKIFRIDGEIDVTRELLSKVQDGTLKKICRNACRYSPVEINFQYQRIESIRAKQLDDDNFTTKSGPNLANEISQLLVDIYNQDAKEALNREKQYDGTQTTYKKHEGNYDRFKNAYSKMFNGKSLGDVETNGNEYQIFFHDDLGNSFTIDSLSSGEKQLVYRAGYLLSNLNNIESGIVLIDEPELSLHPSWQEKYLNFLKDIFTTDDNTCKIQFIIATHSPYIIKGANHHDTNIWQYRRDVDGFKVQNIKDSWSVLPVGPTLGEITYKAFEMPNIEFHCDLYNALQIKLAPNKKIVELEEILVNQESQPKEIVWNCPQKGKQEETLMTSIRHKIHHSDNTSRPEFTNKQLAESIERMIGLL